MTVAAISDFDVPDGGVHVVRMQLLDPLGQASMALAAVAVVPTTTAAAADWTKALRDEAWVLYASVVAAKVKALKVTCEIFMMLMIWYDTWYSNVC